MTSGDPGVHQFAALVSGARPRITLDAANEALRQSEERLRLMVEAVREYAIFVLDPQGHVASWNLGAQRLKGYSADEIRGRHFSVFYTDEDRRRHHPEEVLQWAAERGSYSEEGWRVRKDGSRFFASITITALRNPDGVLYGFGKVTADLTARRRAEEDALRLAEAQAARDVAEKLHRITSALAAALNRDTVARVVFETVLPVLAADGASIVIRDPATDLLRLAWAHGYSSDVAERYRAFSMQDDAPHCHAAREQKALFLDAKEEVDRAYPQRGPGSELRSIMVLPLLVRGACLGLLCITSRRERSGSLAERALALACADQCALALDRALLFERELEARTRAGFLAEAGAVLSSTLDTDEVLRRLAKLAVPRLGDWCSIELVEGDSSREAAVAHTDPEKVRLAHELRSRFPPNREHPGGLFEVLRTGRAELYAEITEEMLTAATRSPEELAIYRAVGMRSVLIVPLVVRGRILGAMTLVWAESSRHYTSEDLAFVSDLCARAALSVENARMYQELEKAVRIRDDFLSIAGHEIRTPLTALELHLQTVLRASDKDPSTLTPRLRERVRKALADGGRLERLVEELLDVSRITSSGLRLDPEDVDLSQILGDIVVRLRDQAEREGSELRLLRTEPLLGFWDRLRIEQVVSNLLTNALKYGRGKPVELEVRAEQGMAVLHVRDFGIGISPENQRRIFERFERAVSGRNYGGFGLGLWIARQIVDASGGTLSVESVPGMGSTFTLKRPLKNPKASS
jgi:PAS domain S-box-containing protein